MHDMGLQVAGYHIFLLKLSFHVSRRFHSRKHGVDRIHERH